MKLHNKIKTHHWPILLLVIFFSASIISCKKYEDGPWISLKTKKKRLYGEWTVASINGEDQSSTGKLTIDFQKKTFNPIVITFSSFNEESNESYAIKGQWKWKSYKEIIDVRADILKADWTILRLKKKEFWFLDEHDQTWKCEKN